ncbi:hypothetical protein [Domibacillus indicus]|uniref:hypothetical protein n=1 Tax=Domibacillus indicus TaxID=1437523 RepID=UPI000617FF13|nr:hypothetical protein [Domibacillus indicus]
MFQSFVNLADAQKISLITTLITAMVAIATLFFTIKINRNTVYSNSVTKERIESMKNLKINSSKFNGLIYNFLTNPEAPIDRKELYSLKNLIEYQLNDTRSNERELLIKINNLVSIHDYYFDETITQYSDLKMELNKKGITYTDQLIFINNKRFLLCILKIEFALFEEGIKKHIKSEWDKIKSEVKF